MLKIESEKIIEAYNNKKYPYYKKGDFNVNFFGIRCVDTFDNKFSDILGMAYNENGELKIIQIPGTTRPGLHGGHAVMNPRPGGVACIVPGYYPRVWKFIDGDIVGQTGNNDIKYDYSKLWLKYPYFYQVGKFKIWRDEDKDTEIDHVNEQDVADAGLNCHRMSWDGVSCQAGVNNWSEGCQGAEEPEFKKLLPVARESVKIYGDIFSFALFELKDFDCLDMKGIYMPMVTA